MSSLPYSVFSFSPLSRTCGNTSCIVFLFAMSSVDSAVLVVHGWNERLASMWHPVPWEAQGRLELQVQGVCSGAMPVRRRGEREAMLVGGESLGLRCRRCDTIKEGEGGWGCAENIGQLLKGPTLHRNSQSPTPHHAQNLSRAANENQPRLRPQNGSCRS